MYTAFRPQKVTQQLIKMPGVYIAEQFPIWYDASEQTYLFVMASIHSESESEYTGFYTPDGITVNTYVSKLLYPVVKVGSTILYAKSFGSDYKVYWESVAGDRYWNGIYVPSTYKDVIHPHQALPQPYRFKNTKLVAGSMIDNDVYAPAAGWFTGHILEDNWFNKVGSAPGLKQAVYEYESVGVETGTLNLKMEWGAPIYKGTSMPQLSEYRWDLAHVKSEETNRLRNFTQLFSKLDGISGTAGSIEFETFALFSQVTIPTTVFIRQTGKADDKLTCVTINNKNVPTATIQWNSESEAYILGTVNSSDGWYELTAYPTVIGQRAVFQFKKSDPVAGEDPILDKADIQIEKIGETLVQKQMKTIGGVGVWV